MAVTHSTPTLQKAHNCFTRALRHAEGRDLVRRNVSALAGTPHGREGRPSQALTLEQAAALPEAAEDSRLHAYVVCKRWRKALRYRLAGGGSKPPRAASVKSRAVSVAEKTRQGLRWVRIVKASEN